uniref:Uncharacterized protein n=1 Tax=Rhizophora mucronata TaxID=61149 RepID=A0A2P2J478_RHIMU
MSMNSESPSIRNPV